MSDVHRRHVPGDLHTAQAKLDNTREAVRDKTKQAQDSVQQTGIWQRLATAQQNLNQRDQVSWSKVLGVSLFTGVTFGTFVQVSHNNGFLPMYDYFAFTINTPLGPAVESMLVPLLLAPIWLLYAWAYPLADAAYEDDEATETAQLKARSLSYNLLNWGVITAMFLLSSYLYLSDFPHWQIYAILYPLWIAQYKAFDNTKQGLFLGLLLAAGAPVVEMFIANVLHLWHYDRPDLNGVCFWASACYAAYAHGVGNFGRYLVQTQKKT